MSLASLLLRIKIGFGVITREAARQVGLSAKGIDGAKNRRGGVVSIRLSQ